LPGASSRSEWLLVIAALAIAGLLWNVRGRGPRAGDVVDAPLTLTTADRDQLACALDRPVGPWRCAFTASGQPAGVSRPLAPYLTTTRALYLIPGLFEQPALAARLREEPPEDRPPESLRRFVALCRVRLREPVDAVRVRWASRSAFGPEERAWAAEPLDCKVEDR
jgi:hypothetical protein